MTSFDRFEKENHISHLSRILIENETEILRVCHNNIMFVMKSTIHFLFMFVVWNKRWFKYTLEDKEYVVLNITENFHKL